MAMLLMPTNIDNWTHCTACYVRCDHVYDSEMDAWRCEFCGIVNEELTRLRKAIVAVAKSYLKENPEEE